MSDMKCPFCQQELLLSSLRTGDEEHQMWGCLRCELSAYRKIWEALIRTRKALDVAVDALNTIKGKHDPRCAVYHIDEKTAYDALEQITALEQKDVK